jgi:NADH-quinone oxidoreductase subunit G
VGNDIYIWGNRCIVCTRCVRFCEEVSGTGELCVVERGDHSVIDVHPAYPLQNALSGNVVDICPVGALIAKDFLYQARVWYQQKTESICTTCARGCNIEVQTLGNTIKRVVPRHNPHVNQYWMCDHGRFDHKYVLGERRSLRYRLPVAPERAGTFLASELKRAAAAHGPAAVAAIASAFLTTEEAYLLRQFIAGLGAPAENVAAWARPPGKEEVFKSGFRIAADKNPNRAGVERVLGAGVFDRRLEAVLRGVETGAVKALVLVSDRPHLLAGEGPGEERLLARLPGLDFLAVFELEHGAAFPESAALLPATAFPEKDGTMVNDDGRIQRLRPATALPRGIRGFDSILQEALVALGTRDRSTSPAGVFRELASGLGLDGATYKEIGNQGLAPRPQT